MPQKHDFRKELGKVTEFYMGQEDHNIWTFFLRFKLASATQSFGNYVLSEYSREDARHVGSASGMDMLIQICTALAVRDVSKLMGKTCWVLYSGHSSPIHGIQQLETDGEGLFLVETWQKRWFPGGKS